MLNYNLQNMIKGWFVGDISPVAFSSPNCEVAYKKYKSGDYDPPHFHKIATEITLICSGKVLMNGTEYKTNDIVVISPDEITDFKVLEDTNTVVVKIPGVKDDKYLVDIS